MPVGHHSISPAASLRSVPSLFRPGYSGPNVEWRLRDLLRRTGLPATVLILTTTCVVILWAWVLRMGFRDGWVGRQAQSPQKPSLKLANGAVDYA